MSIKKIVISGGYGMGNIGDEAIVETIINDIWSIEKQSKIIVLVRDREKWLMAHPHMAKDKRVLLSEGFFIKSHFKSITKLFSVLISIFHIAQADLFIWGGGNLLGGPSIWIRRYMFSLRVAQFFKRKIYICSVGVNYIYENEKIKLLKKIKTPILFTVRDSASKEYLMGIEGLFKEKDIKIVRDPAFHFLDYYRHKNYPVKKIKRNPILIGVNVAGDRRGSLVEPSDEEKSSWEIIAYMLNDLSKTFDFEIVYLPTVKEKDWTTFKMFRKIINKNIKVAIINTQTPYEYLRNLTNLDVFIGMRMHSLILSYVIGVPTFSLVYDEKVKHMRDELSLEDSIFLRKDAELLKKKIENLLSPHNKRITTNSSKIYAAIEDSKILKENIKKILSD